jgi:Uma2 family endonuclease
MDESRAWPRYELLDGELLVTPAPGWSHQAVIMEIAFALEAYVRREPVGMVLTSPADLELRKGTITQPDVFVVPAGVAPAGERLEWSDVRSLLLAVEVLSPASVGTDRVRKREFYLENGVAEYWIADVDARFVEVWTPQRATPSIVDRTLSWRVGDAATPLMIDLPELFDRVATKLRGAALPPDRP